jgi:RND family efflux transporter MFP subunit
MSSSRPWVFHVTNRVPVFRALGGICTLVSIVAGCSPPPAAPQPPEPPVVTVANPVARELTPYTEFVGRTDAVRTVEVVPEVTGVLLKVRFKDGSLINVGDVLYEIDPVPFRATAERAAADAANAKAQLALAEAELKQAKQASAGGALSVNELDKAVAKRDSSAAQVKAAEAEIVRTTFNLDKTVIKAPIAGRIERTLLTEGNLVTANATKLTRIVSLNPIYAYWDVDEMTSLRYRNMIHKDKTMPNPRDSTPLRCWIRLKNESKFEREGFVDYIDPGVNRASATRPLRGTFTNDDGFMTPGDSVRVRVEAGPSRPALFVPETAVGSQQGKKYVYTINDKNEAAMTFVELGELRDGLQVVEKGLSAQDRVVVNGLLRVRPGAVVKPVSQ